MKKVFLGISYILLVVMLFVYYLIPCVYNGGNYQVSLLQGVINTGISLIGFVFVFPAFVFTILALFSDKAMVSFLRDSFALFASVFTIGTIFIGAFCHEIAQGYVFFILGTVTLLLTILSGFGVAKALLLEKNKKNIENADNEEVIQ